MPSHYQVAHRWAQMNSNGHATGHHMWFDGLSIFSYGRHFEIARWTPTLANEKKRVQQGIPAMCVLFTADGVSVSTAKHKTITRRAIRSTAFVFTLPHALWDNPIAALRYYEDAALGELEKATRARTWAESYRSNAERILNEAQNFALAFNVKWKRPDTTELRARADKAIKAAEKARKAAEKVRQERYQAQLLKDKVDLEDWINGLIHWVPNSCRTNSDGTVFVRRKTVRSFGEIVRDELETSMNAVVPWQHALKAFQFIKLCRERHQGWKRNGHSIRVGHFQIDSIDDQGNMTAGCHRFSWGEMERLAIREGVAGFEPSDSVLEPKG